ncbi:hypothetical protein AGLY_015412 [Aphis glycines]|uniref:Uncharacterized protein n=1 Tax=Aphis glycines TaxID=307491 RepID=A0A6G0T2N6_APHGL|nr:hypothetical protein AGLY_015412 [Aphis glycines]
MGFFKTLYINHKICFTRLGNTCQTVGSNIETFKQQTPLQQQQQLSMPLVTNCVKTPVSFAYTNKSEGFPACERATYSCPCEKHGFSEFSPHTCSVYTCAFLEFEFLLIQNKVNIIRTYKDSDSMRFIKFVNKIRIRTLVNLAEIELKTIAQKHLNQIFFWLIESKLTRQNLKTVDFECFQKSSSIDPNLT